jgi:hypothetical protein
MITPVAVAKYPTARSMAGAPGTALGVWAMHPQRAFIESLHVRHLHERSNESFSPGQLIGILSLHNPFVQRGV